GGLGDILSRLPIPGDNSSQRRPQRPASTDRGGFDTGGTMGDDPGFNLPKSNVPAGGYPMPPIPRGPEDSDSGRDLGSRRSGGPASQLPFPLPGPGDRQSSDNPYGDLSDILRLGGRLPSGERAGGGGLG